MTGLLRTRVATATRQLIAGLSLVGLALGLLGFWMWQASVRRHQVAIDLLRSHAELAAQRLGDRIQNELYVGAMAVFRPVTGARDSARMIGASAILDAAAAAESCNCAPPMRPAYAFRTDLSSAGSEFAGRDRPNSSEQTAIVSAIAEQLTRHPGGWQVAILRGLPVLAGRTVVFTRAAGVDAPRVYVGFATDSTTLREFIVWPLLCNTRLLATDRAGGIPNDSLVAIRVADASGAPLYRTSSSVIADLSRATTFAVEWGELSISASLTARGAELVLPGGIPRSPVPALVGVMLTAATLVGIAALMLWRMHELGRLRTDFTSSVSHELRTPLTQILLYAETIEMGRERSAAKRAEAIGVITRETRRLIHLVENVLHFSRAERSLTRLRLRTEDLAALVAETAVAFEPVAAARGMRVALSPGGGVFAAVDADAMRRVTLNLLDNAVRYGPAGQTITASVRRVGDRARVTVEDEGPGVPRGRRDAIWQPFVRLEDSSSDSTTGCGMGLAIVNELVTLHGGTCGVESRRAGGASFFVDLPAANAPNDGDDADVAHELAPLGGTRG